LQANLRAMLSGSRHCVELYFYKSGPKGDAVRRAVSRATCERLRPHTLVLRELEYYKGYCTSREGADKTDPFDTVL